MSDGLGLWQALQDSMRMYRDAVAEIGPSGARKAEAEGEYRAALAKRELELRTTGKHPVGMIRDLARGADSVRRAFVEWQSAEALYDATIEQVNFRKREVDVLREQMEREARGL